MSGGLRFKVQRFGTWEWLDIDAPLTTGGPEWGDSMIGAMKATISPDRGYATAPDGHPVYEPWSTWVHVETPGERRWSGIVREVRVKGAALELEIVEWIGYLADLLFQGRIWGVQADPADLVRQLIAHVQSYPTGKLGITVTGSTPVRLGTASSDQAIAAKAAMKTAKSTLDARTKTRKAKEVEIQTVTKPYTTALKTLEAQRTAASNEVARLTKIKAPASQINAAKATLTARQNAIKAKRTERDNRLAPLKTQLASLKASEEAARKPYDAAQAASQAADERERADGGAYRVFAADNPDCWQILKDICADAPLAFTTHTTLSDGPPKLELRLHYPRTGTYRDDLIFKQGLNIAAPLEPGTTGEYASEVTVIGAGEGDLAIRQTVPRTDHRMRRTALVDDKRITTAARAGVVAREEAAARAADLEFSEITVREHPLCPLWSWNVGDDILVQGTVPHLGKVAIKHRIKSWALLSDSKAVLKLERSR